MRKYDVDVPASLLETAAGSGESPVVVEADTLTDLLSNVLGRVQEARKTVVQNANAAHKEVIAARAADLDTTSKRTSTVKADLARAKKELEIAENHLESLGKLDTAQQAAVEAAQEKKAQIVARARETAEAARAKSKESLKSNLAIVDRELQLIKTIRELVAQMKQMRPKKKGPDPPPPPTDDVDTVAVMFAAAKKKEECVKKAKAAGVQGPPFKSCDEAFNKERDSVQKEIVAQAGTKAAAAKEE